MISLWLTVLASIAHPVKDFSEIKGDHSIIIESKKIEFPEFPNAFNPSLIKTSLGYILTFRYCQDHEINNNISYIGVALLDDRFEPIDSPQLLNTRNPSQQVPTQSEDARIFSFRDRIFLIYNDNPEIFFPDYSEPRDMYIAELFFKEKIFSLSLPKKLFCKEKAKQLWQKNWVPFEWHGKLFFAYSINPHEILQPNLITGECFSIYKTESFLEWDLGILRGSSVALLTDGEYLSFFHSGIPIPASLQDQCNAWYYFMGAYTFEKDPPFTIQKFTPLPIFNEGFYDPEAPNKKVIFPGGFVDGGDLIYVAYGKDDREIWIATLNKESLKRALKPVAR